MALVRFRATHPDFAGGEPIFGDVLGVDLDFDSVEEKLLGWVETSLDVDSPREYLSYDHEGLCLADTVWCFGDWRIDVFTIDGEEV